MREAVAVWVTGVVSNPQDRRRQLTISDVSIPRVLGAEPANAKYLESTLRATFSTSLSVCPVSPQNRSPVF